MQMKNTHGGIALIGFDADDTLWRSQDYFDEEQLRLENILSNYVDLADVGHRLYLSLIHISAFVWPPDKAAAH